MANGTTTDTTVTDVAKPAWQSKTAILNAFVAISVLFWPAAQVWVGEHPEVVMSIFAILNVALRFITKDKITLSMKPKPYQKKLVSPR